MIGKISGIVDHIAADHALIDVRGVGYLVYCSDRTRAALPAPGEAVALYTELVVREDLLQLYGFTTLAEKEWHRLLTSVQGIGAKVALAILGTLGPDGVGRAITLGDVAAVKSAPGVGPKTAQRVVLELKDKVPSVMALGAGGARRASTLEAETEVVEKSVPISPAVSEDVDAGAQADALSALINLGYAHGDAAEAVARATDAGASGAQEMIRAALKLMAPKG